MNFCLQHVIHIQKAYVSAANLSCLELILVHPVMRQIFVNTVGFLFKLDLALCRVSVYSAFLPAALPIVWSEYKNDIQGQLTSMSQHTTDTFSWNASLTIDPRVENRYCNDADGLQCPVIALVLNFVRLSKCCFFRGEQGSQWHKKTTILLKIPNGTNVYSSSKTFAALRGITVRRVAVKDS